jgi:V/A-type H+-transporting ATPase subunit F
MKIVMFGDEESINLLHLVGIEGISFEKEDEKFEDKFEDITEDPDVGIIIISEHLLVKHRDIIFPFKMQKRLPIIIEIPGIMPEYKEDYTRELARKYIGIDI